MRMSGTPPSLRKVRFFSAGSFLISSTTLMEPLIHKNETQIYVRRCICDLGKN